MRAISAIRCCLRPARRKTYALLAHKVDSFSRYGVSGTRVVITAIVTVLDSDSGDSPLVRGPRLITLGGMESPRPTSLRRMESPRPPTGKYLAELNDNERSVFQFILELENRGTTGHAPVTDVEHDTGLEPVLVTDSGGDADLSAKDKTSAEKEINFALANLLPMRWTGTDFDFDEEIDPEQERSLNVKKNLKWEKHFPTRSSFKSVRRLVLQTSPPAGFLFLIPASHQRPWTPPAGYACVYESWFNNCSLWWPLPEFLTTYCFWRRIALGQYTANVIRILVTLTVLAAELDIKMLVRLFEELTTPSITAKTGFFYGKMVPNYNVITGKPSKVNFWNQAYFYVKNNDASFEDCSWAQVSSQSFREEVEAIRTLSHQHWPDIREACIQAALNIIIRGNYDLSCTLVLHVLYASLLILIDFVSCEAETAVKTSSRDRGQRMGKLNLASIPSYANSIGSTPLRSQEESPDSSRPEKRRRAPRVDEGALNVSTHRSPPPERLAEHLGDKVRSRESSPERNPAPEHADEVEVIPTTDEPTEDNPAAHDDDEVVEYPHLIDFCYQHTDVLFFEDHEALTRLFRQIKLKKKGMPELDELSQNSEYQEMTRAGAIISTLCNRVPLLSAILLTIVFLFCLVLRKCQSHG
ncbi:hypothetical protein N665_0018s0017 [Sinapis alba]|nr:hypothetical protein N665_0018s0017 [Sinapis alba]